MAGSYMSASSITPTGTPLDSALLILFPLLDSSTASQLLLLTFAQLRLMVTYILQLVTVGFLWVTIHCAGMCGPIVAGLNAGTLEHRDPDTDPDDSLLKRGAINIFAYQIGRAVTYAVMGALAGLLGASLEAAILEIGRIAALLAGGGLILAGVGTMPLIRRLLSSTASTSVFGGITSRLGRVARRLTDLIPASGRLRIALFGAVMGFLPCMLMFWVLALAASTAQPLAGAGLMVGLVIMTTPVLLLAGSSPLLASGRLKRWSGVIRSGAMIGSGLWLTLIGMAHNGWISHQKIIFELADRSFTIMFW
jgi:sulfite exporter TauE/SafE